MTSLCPNIRKLRIALLMSLIKKEDFKKRIALCDIVEALAIIIINIALIQHEFGQSKRIQVQNYLVLVSGWDHI
jgi:hypothetical protein